MLLKILSGDKATTIDLILSSDENNNTLFKRLIVETINTNLKYRKSEVKNFLAQNNQSNKEAPLVIEFLDYLLSLFPTELSKSWTRMCPFLEIKLHLNLILFLVLG